MTDVVGNPEEERRADFFHLPWSQEAVCRYFYGKVSERLISMVVNSFLGALHLSELAGQFWKFLVSGKVSGKTNKQTH